jgi:hypothetical protein
MAQSSLTNGESGLNARNAINANFAEVYTGANIHAATAKTTPVDADEVGVIDSAASNVLKKVTWVNIKATLKTYFDTLYVAARSFGTAAALDVGTTANKVVQLDGAGKLPALDGSQLTGISGGGGSTLVRAYNPVTGHTVADVPASGASGNVSYNSTITPTDGYSIHVAVTVGGSGTFDQVFEFNNSGQLIGGSIVIAYSDVTSANAAFLSALSSAAFPGSATDDSVSTLAFATSAAGANVSLILSCASVIGTPTYSGGGTTAGVDDVPEHGGVPEVELVAAVAGKKIKMVGAWLSNPGAGFPACPVSLSLKFTGTYIDLATLTGAGVLQPIDASAAIWLAGNDAGESLVLRYTGAPGFGTVANCAAIVEQS